MNNKSDCAISDSAGKAGARGKYASSEKSHNRILDAALEAVGRYGLHSLSMSDVSRVAGVARGTLYRYFSSKEVLLAALGLRTRERFEKGMLAAAEQATNSRALVFLVLNSLSELSRTTYASDLLTAEPEFFTMFIRDNLAFYSDLLASTIAPFFDELDGTLGYTVDRKLVAEMLLRLHMSYILVPSKESLEQSLEKLIDTMFAAAPSLRLA